MKICAKIIFDQMKLINERKNNGKEEMTMASFYDYSVFTPKGEEVSMKQFEGKVVLVVNTATGCGFTPQYKDLEAM